MPSHTHPPVGGPSFVIDKGTTTGTGFKFTGTGTFDMASGAASNTGGGAAHGILSPFLGINFIIKT